MSSWDCGPLRYPDYGNSESPRHLLLSDDQVNGSTPIPTSCKDISYYYKIPPTTTPSSTSTTITKLSSLSASTSKPIDDDIYRISDKFLIHLANQHGIYNECEKAMYSHFYLIPSDVVMIISAYSVPLLIVAATLKRQHHATQTHARHYYELALQDKTLSLDDHKQARDSVDVYNQYGLDSGALLCKDSDTSCARAGGAPREIDEFDDLDRKANEGCVHSMYLLRFHHSWKLHVLQKSRDLDLNDSVSPAEYSRMWQHHDTCRKLFMRRSAEHGYRQAQFHMINDLNDRIDNADFGLVDNHVKLQELQDELFYWLRRYGSQCKNNSLATSMGERCIQHAVGLLFGNSANVRSNDVEARKCLGIKAHQ